MTTTEDIQHALRAIELETTYAEEASQRVKWRRILATVQALTEENARLKADLARENRWLNNALEKLGERG